MAILDNAPSVDTSGWLYLTNPCVYSVGAIPVDSSDLLCLDEEEWALIEHPDVWCKACLYRFSCNNQRDYYCPLCGGGLHWLNPAFYEVYKAFVLHVP